MAVRRMPGQPAVGFGPGWGFHRGGAFGNRRFFPHHHRHFFFNSGCFNGFCNPGYYGYYAPPIFWSGFDYLPSYDYGAQAYTAQPAHDDSALRAEIQRLSDEVQQLREEQQARNRPAQPAAESRPSRPDPPTILVFQDGGRSEVQNYAIVGRTLWVFHGQQASKIPLRDLDLVATKNVNEERGVDFVVPESR